MIILSIGEGWRPFPLSIEKIEIYSPPPPAGTRVPVFLQMNRISSKRISVDYEVQNGSGMVWMRVKNWGFWVFNWTHRVVDYLRFPQKYFLCKEKKLSLLPEGAICQFISKKDLPDLKLDWLARITLSLDEMDTFFSFSENPKYQHHWFYGQLAAKDAVRLWLKRNSNIRSLHPAAFSVEKDNGSSVVEGLDDVSPLPQVSIAHLDDRAIAIAHEKVIGIDMEVSEDRGSAFIETFSTPRERNLLQKFPPSDRHRWTTSLWCAKKAAGKATETADIKGEFLSLEAIHMDDNGVITVIHHTTGRKFRVSTQEEDNYIIAFTFDADPP
jgi:phosphopantetheinyl transferase (holo-ACP synthase)